MRIRLLIACVCTAGSLWAQRGSDAPQSPDDKSENSRTGDKSAAPTPPDGQREKGAPDDDAPKKAKPPKGSDKSESSDPSLTDDARATIVGILAKVGAEDAQLKVVERTSERQARVMYALAREDVERALGMYCSAGDAVIQRFDPKQGEAQNLANMEAELQKQLPHARELGCLNHIKNDEVVTVDVALEAVPESRYEDLLRVAKAAIKAGRLERFLYPPSHPGSFHFELTRYPQREEPTSDEGKQPTKKPR